MTATALTRADVRSAYRYLLRSIGIAFQEDRVTLSAARAEAHRRFHEANKTMDIGSPEAWEGFKEARDISKFLRENLVQGIKDPETGAYRLRIHDETERGDNATIKNPPPMPMPERKSRRKTTQLS